MNQVEIEGGFQRTNIFSISFAKSMAITLQRSNRHWQKLRLAHLLPLINICAKYEKNQIKTEVYTRGHPEVMRQRP